MISAQKIQDQNRAGENILLHCLGFWSIILRTSFGVQLVSDYVNLLPNDALSNVNYFENGAYLDLDLDISDVIAYIPDTSKFGPSGTLLIIPTDINQIKRLL